MALTAGASPRSSWLRAVRRMGSWKSPVVNCHRVPEAVEALVLYLPIRSWGGVAVVAGGDGAVARRVQPECCASMMWQPGMKRCTAARCGRRSSRPSIRLKRSRKRTSSEAIARQRGLARGGVRIGPGRKPSVHDLGGSGKGLGGHQVAKERQLIPPALDVLVAHRRVRQTRATGAGAWPRGPRVRAGSSPARSRPGSPSRLAYP